MVNGDNCFVSDFGFGSMEAEMYGAESFYESNAKKAADRFGVGFDGMGSIFQDVGLHAGPPRRRRRGGRQCVGAGRDGGDHARFGGKGAAETT